MFKDSFNTISPDIKVQRVYDHDSSDEGLPPTRTYLGEK